MVRRTAVFARPEESKRQIKAHPQQRRVTRQNGAEAGNGGFPVAPAKGDRAVKKVQLVDICLARIDSLKQDLGVIQRAGRQRCAASFKQGLRGD